MTPEEQPQAPAEITVLLERAKSGEQAALDSLIPLVYNELHRLARSELRRDRAGHTLQPTALVNEAYLRMFGSKSPGFEDRAHFLGIASRVMRQVLIDYARMRGRRKRQGGIRTELFEDIGASPSGSAAGTDLLEVDQALNRLGEEDGRLVTLVEMRFFAGMTAEETAEVRGESVNVIRHDLRYAQARLRQLLAS